MSFSTTTSRPFLAGADMTGSYTRYGLVSELLDRVDDRYVVMKGGDSVRLEFDASRLQPPPVWGGPATGSSSWTAGTKTPT